MSGLDAQPLRAFSYGGGVQSTAALVLAAQGTIDFPVFLFANTGDDSEHPATLEYVRSIAVPYAAKHGIELHELRKEWADGRGWTLHERLTLSPSFDQIPMRQTGGKPNKRGCTVDFKIQVIAKWLKARGASKENRAHVGLGISLDEFERMSTASTAQEQIREYPLYDLRLDRAQCIGIIERAGMPVPPKSACWFCPYHRLSVWREMKRKEPELFRRSVELERHIIDKRVARGRTPLYMSRALRPLDEAVGPHTQPSLFDEDDACESGYCMT